MLLLYAYEQTFSAAAVDYIYIKRIETRPDARDRCALSPPQRRQQYSRASAERLILRRGNTPFHPHIIYVHHIRGTALTAEATTALNRPRRLHGGAYVL